MRTLKARLTKLEEQFGGMGGRLHYLMVCVGDGETENEALARTAGERSVSMEQVGAAVFVGNDSGISEKVYIEGDMETFTGYREFRAIVGNVLREIQATPDGLPASFECEPYGAQ